MTDPPDWVKLSTKTISGKAVIPIEPSEVGYRFLYLDISCIRENETQYKNFKFLPPRSFYANITGVTDNHVVWESAVYFDPQRIYLPNLQDNQETNKQIECLSLGVQGTIRNLALALGLTSFTPVPPEPIFIWDLFPSELRINCDSRVVLEISIWGVDYFVCDDLADTPPPPPKKPPPPPTPRPKVIPNTPVVVDNRRSNSDNPLDDPADLDKEQEPPPPPPPPRTCDQFRVFGSFKRFGQGTVYSFDGRVWGDVTGVEIINDELVIICYGDVYAGACRLDITNVILAGQVETIVSQTIEPY